MDYIKIIELIGTIAFAASGAVVAFKKKMDIFGVVTLGLVTAVGGGLIRDIILGSTPPVMFQDPIYAVVAVITSVVIFLPPVRKELVHTKRWFDVLMNVVDAVGLGIFTAVGVMAAAGTSFFQGVMMGAITGVGGGMLRDVMSGEMPYIFVKDFYACASLVGAIICQLVFPAMGKILATILCTVIVVTLRLLASKFKWHLPV